MLPTNTPILQVVRSGDLYVEPHDSGLTDSQVAAIEATLPRCPACGGGIERVPFIRRTVHRFTIEIDGCNGDVLADSRLYDTTEEQPEWQTVVERGQPVSVLRVECADRHDWLERRLDYRFDMRSGEWRWSILPVQAAEANGGLVQERLPSGELAWLRAEAGA